MDPEPGAVQGPETVPGPEIMPKALNPSQDLGGDLQPENVVD
jgi:hypothetical protein